MRDERSQYDQTENNDGCDYPSEGIGEKQLADQLR